MLKTTPSFDASFPRFVALRSQTAFQSMHAHVVELLMHVFISPDDDRWVGALDAGR